MVIILAQEQQQQQQHQQQQQQNQLQPKEDWNEELNDGKLKFHFYLLDANLVNYCYCCNRLLCMFISISLETV